MRRPPSPDTEAPDTEAPDAEGLSLGEEAVAGFDWIDRSITLGSGAECFEQAAARLMSWQLHQGAGLRVEGPGKVAPGARAVLRTRIGGVWLPAPVQVVRVLEEPTRRGFCYRTLPGHPEEGEESFVITLHADGTVQLRIRAWSRPATWWARLGAPLARRVQARITDRHLAALAGI